MNIKSKIRIVACGLLMATALCAAPGCASHSSDADADKAAWAKQPPPASFLAQMQKKDQFDAAHKNGHPPVTPNTPVQ